MDKHASNGAISATIDVGTLPGYQPKVSSTNPNSATALKKYRKELVKVVSYVDPSTGNPSHGVILGVFKEDLLQLSASVCSSRDTFNKELGIEKARTRMDIAPQLQLYYNSKYWKGIMSKRTFFQKAAQVAKLLLIEERTALIPIQ